MQCRQERRVCRVYLPRQQDSLPRNSAAAADRSRRGDRIGPLQALSKSFHLCRHVGKAAYPIGRVATFENPNCVIRLRALRVPHSADWFVTGNALHAYLCREHVPRRFPCGLCRRSDQATARTVNNQNGNDREEAYARSPKNRGQQSKALEMLTGFHGTSPPSDDSNKAFRTKNAVRFPDCRKRRYLFV